MAFIATICLTFYTLTKSLLYDVQTSLGWPILTTTEYLFFLTNESILYVPEALEIFLFTKSNGHWVWSFCLLSLPRKRVLLPWVRVLNLSFDLLWMLRMQIYCVPQGLQGSHLSESCSNLCDCLDTQTQGIWLNYSTTNTQEHYNSRTLEATKISDESSYYLVFFQFGYIEPIPLQKSFSKIIPVNFLFQQKLEFQKIQQNYWGKKTPSDRH